MDSLRRKLTEMLELDPDLELNDASERVYDALRYTVVVEADDYMAVYEGLLAELRRQGTRWSRRATDGRGPATAVSTSISALG